MSWSYGLLLSSVQSEPDTTITVDAGAIAVEGQTVDVIARIAVVAGEAAAEGQTVGVLAGDITAVETGDAAFAAQNVSVLSSVQGASKRPNLFRAKLHKTIFKAFNGKLLDATLTKTTQGTRASGSLTAGRTSGASETSYACQGFTSMYRQREIDGTSVLQGDRKILILGGSLDDTIEPAPGDTILIEGIEWRIVDQGVKRDPVGATFVCQGRQ